MAVDNTSQISDVYLSGILCNLFKVAIKFIES